MKELTIYTFGLFWASFHFRSKLPMKNKQKANEIWDNITSNSIKIKAIDSIKAGSKLTAVEYLK